MKDDIKKDITTIYEKIDKNTTERLKKYKEDIEELEAKSRRFWAIEGVKEALFWCMCLAILLLVGRATLEIYGVTLPVIVWQILYPCSFIPLVAYFIRSITGKSEKKSRRKNFFDNYK